MQFDGLFFFPVTPFTSAGEVDIEVYTAHVSHGMSHGVGGIFPACGTGEFAALTSSEVDGLVEATVAVRPTDVPVIVGAGGGVGSARERIARAAERGADGALLFGPGGHSAGEDGLIAYIEAVADRSPVPLIVYQRDSFVLSVSGAVRVASIPNVIGIKDGTGRIELLARQVAAVHAVQPDFSFINGLPTAEVSMGAYSAIGVTQYSSAVFAFAPRQALAFHEAHASGDAETQRKLLDLLFLPFAELRDRRGDYPVSLVKAGVGLNGLEVGSPRAPLATPRHEDLRDLEALLNSAGALVSS